LSRVGPRDPRPEVHSARVEDGPVARSVALRAALPGRDAGIEVSAVSGAVCSETLRPVRMSGLRKSTESSRVAGCGRLEPDGAIDPSARPDRPLAGPVQSAQADIRLRQHDQLFRTAKSSRP
jgi:hypothetical protein